MLRALLGALSKKHRYMWPNQAVRKGELLKKTKELAWFSHGRVRVVYDTRRNLRSDFAVMTVHAAWEAAAVGAPCQVLALADMGECERVR